MRSSPKNKPSKIFIISMIALVIMIIGYLLLVVIFPELLSSLNGTNILPEK